MTKEEINKFIEEYSWRSPNYKTLLFKNNDFEIAGIVSHTVKNLNEEDVEKYLDMFVSKVMKVETWDQYLELIGPSSDGEYGINCMSKNCMYSRSCAQHVTAGDYRSADGMTPAIINVNGHISCKKVETHSSNPVYINSYGEIIRHVEADETGVY